MAQAKLESQFYTKNYVTGAVTEAYAGFLSYADEKYAQISALATYKYTDENGEVFTMAGLKSYVDKEVARNELIASFTKNGLNSYSAFIQEVNEELANNRIIAMFERNGITNMSRFEQYVTDQWVGFDMVAQFGYAGIENMSQLVAYADEHSAYSTLLSEFKNAHINSLAGLINYVDENSASSSLVASFEEEGIYSLAQLVNYVDRESASSSLVAQFGDTVAFVEAISSPYGANVNIYGNVNILSGKTFYYYGDRVGWTYVQNNSTGETWQVLGLYGQNGIYI